eukprot:gb/GFBE01021693.1/.p1 GENE.gb/GFBE01021693.1/~~gb/GFBE01021693.1/.p1  ORF type:complete len:374 (+),score=38.22 gb/GFBE01021693.1/:1-1122(+)
MGQIASFVADPCCAAHGHHVPVTFDSTMQNFAAASQPAEPAAPSMVAAMLAAEMAPEDSASPMPELDTSPTETSKEIMVSSEEKPGWPASPVPAAKSATEPPCPPSLPAQCPTRPRKGSTVRWAPSPPRSPAAQHRSERSRLFRRRSASTPPKPSSAYCSPLGSSPNWGPGHPRFFHCLTSLSNSEASMFSGTSSDPLQASTPGLASRRKHVCIPENYLACRHGCCLAFRPEGHGSKTDRLINQIRQEKANRRQVLDFLVKNSFPGLNEPRRRALGFSHWYPLHCAVAANDANMVKLLLDMRADQNLRDAAGRTPLESALRLSKKKSSGCYSAMLTVLQAQPEDLLGKWNSESHAAVRLSAKSASPISHTLRP